MVHVSHAQPQTTESASLSPLQAVLLRKWSVLALAVLAAAAMAVFASGLPTQYTSEVAVTINGRQLRVINAESLLTNQMLDSEQLRTEMEPLGAIGLAREVVRRLSLNTNPEFCGGATPSLVVRLEARLSGAPPRPASACAVTVDEAARKLLGAIGTRTDGLSYVIRISATAGTPDLSARIANTYADVFIANRRQDVSAVASQTSAWLSTYAEQLRHEVSEADAAVAQYEAAQGLTPLHGGTLTSQTLVDMNGALSQLTGEIAERRAAVGQLQAAANGAGNLSANAMAGTSPLLQALLAKAADQAEQTTRLRTQLGDAHPDVIAAEAQQERLQSQIGFESAKTVRAASSELAALEARRTALQARVDALQVQIGGQGKADVQLQALERDAESKRQIYQSVLSRRMELEAQHGMEQADARIVSEALPPVAPSAPHRTMLVAGAFLAACGLGAALSFPLALLSRRFRSAEHIEEEIGLPILGMFPRPSAGILPHDMICARPGSPEAEAVLRILPHILQHRVRDSATAQTLAVASALPGEGKSSLAVALGRAATQLGVSVLIIDCDLRQPSIAALLDPRTGPRAVTVPVVSSSACRIYSDSQSGLHYITLSSMMGGRPRFVCAEDITVLVNKISPHYQLILLDAPPILVLADALTLATQAQSVLLVVDWRSTPRRAVQAAVQALRRQGANVLGAVASRADLRRDGHATSHYFHHEAHYFKLPLAKASA